MKKFKIGDIVIMQHTLPEFNGSVVKVTGHLHHYYYCDLLNAAPPNNKVILGDEEMVKITDKRVASMCQI